MTLRTGEHIHHWMHGGAPAAPAGEDVEGLFSALLDAPAE